MPHDDYDSEPEEALAFRTNRNALDLRDELNAPGLDDLEARDVRDPNERAILEMDEERPEPPGGFYNTTPAFVPDQPQGTSLHFQPEVRDVPEKELDERSARAYAYEASRTLKMPTGSEIERNRKTILKKSPPGPGATARDLEAYRVQAFNAGIHVTAKELLNHVETLEEYGPHGIIFGEVYGLNRTPGTRLLAQATMAQNPDLVRQTRRGALRAQEALHERQPGYGKPFEAEAALDDPNFDRNMALVARAKPLPKNATDLQLKAYREMLNGIHVRGEETGFAEFENARDTKGLNKLLRPGGADQLQSLTAKVLLDLHREPKDRQLIGADAERFSHALNAHRQVPEHHAQTPAHGIGKQPDYAKLARENHYGERIPATDRERSIGGRQSPVRGGADFGGR